MTHDKNKAADLESKILKTFDYAWNNAGNGPVRQVDILSRLDRIRSIDKHQSILTDLRKWLSPRIKKYVGAKITTSSPSNEDVYPDCEIGPRIFKTSKNRPSLVQPKEYSNDTVCGFRMVDGSVCGTRPDIEREENESMPVNRKSESDPVICGWVGADGFVCKNEPISGRKRCEVHKGRRVTKSVSSVVTPKESSPYLCGVTIADGSICMEPPVHGRKRCELHKGRRIMTKSSLVERNQISVPQAYQIVRPKERSLDVCGVTIADGSICSEPPVHGRKRCELHKGRRIMTKSSLVERNQISVPQAYQIVRPQGSSSDVCGVIIGDGSICMESPVRGRKRCELHKGRRIVTKSSTYW
ncbi:hypothetical protein QJS10_CPB17g01898 [Acorus calamus]|uniref:Uncharacterized protein n=1 Tax=Acorus calamus TaxID=4465 RepID=A0AAV9CUD5_ACOCL|nr:hypothetical protein QJS10_CPB17g01898 [Acorus calamus]